MSNRTRAGAEANSLNTVPLDEVGNVIATGLQAVTFALLDVADAIREQTAALTGDDKRAILIERNQ